MMPLFLRLRVRDKDGRLFGLWLPLFIIWLIIFSLLILAAPFVFLAALCAWRKGTGRIIIEAYFAVFSVIVNLSGLRIEVESKNEGVYIKLK
ncbi:MAG: hypothetical protein JW997_03495 [Actinobacteria bacterium]|nr:hypothetical protein [Actinomycetota bacterium]